MRKPDLTETQFKALETRKRVQGARLRRLRLALGLSQKQAAAIAGISNIRLNRMEAGVQSIDPLALQTFCEANRVGADYVIVASRSSLLAELRDRIAELEDQELEAAKQGQPREQTAPDILARHDALTTPRTPPDHSRKRKQTPIGAILAVVA
jgi:transcriptional regulator with XRE-family HTH domain